MSEWNKLWENWNPDYHCVDYREEWIKAVKAEGDKLNKEHQSLKNDYEVLEAINDILQEKADKWDLLEELMGETGTKMFVEALKKTKEEEK